MRHDACTLVTAGHCLRAQRRVSLCAGRAAAPSSHGPASARTSRDNTDRGHSLHLRCCHTRSSCRPSHRCQHTTPAPLSQWVCLLGHQIQPCAPPEPTVRGPSTPRRAHSAAGTSSCARIGRRSPRRAARSPLSPPPLRTAATPATWLRGKESRKPLSACAFYGSSRIKAAKRKIKREFGTIEANVTF